MSKKKKVLIILISIIVIIGLITGIRTIYGFTVLQKIFSKVEENIQKDNYYLKTICKYDGEETVTEAYYRDGIGRLVAENDIYTWTNGEVAYMVNNETMTLDPLEMENAITLVSSDMFAYLIPGYTDNTFGRILLAGSMRNSIKTETVGEDKCYAIKIEQENSTKTVWINQKTMNPIKAELEFENGSKYEYTYQLAFTATKLTSIELDTSKYTITRRDTEGNLDMDNSAAENTVNADNTIENNTVSNTTNNIANTVNNTNTTNTVESSCCD